MSNVSDDAKRRSMPPAVYDCMYMLCESDAVPPSFIFFAGGHVDEDADPWHRFEWNWYCSECVREHQLEKECSLDEFIRHNHMKGDQ